MKKRIISTIMRLKNFLLNSKQNNQSKTITYLKKYIAKNEMKVLVDIGAHRGLFTKLIAKHFELEKSYLIEPIVDNYNVLVNTFEHSNYEIINSAISDLAEQKIEFHINNYDETSSILNIRKDIDELSNIDSSLNKKVYVESNTLDVIFNKYKIKEISLLKIDVQGCEDLVIKGAGGALKNTKFVWVETSFKPLYENSALFQDIYSLMTTNNFILLEISSGYRSEIQELLQADLLFANKDLITRI